MIRSGRPSGGPSGLDVRRAAAVFLVVWSLAAEAAAAQSVASRIEELIERYHEYHLFNGLVLVAHAGEIIVERGFGEADMAWHVPNGPDTKFRIGSTTKQFTAALILTLVEDGRIDLDATITQYLPNYPAIQGDRVTVHHLLSHTSGIPTYTTPSFMSNEVRDPFEVDSLLALFSGLDLEFEPGAWWSYSNSNFIVLGAIVEAVTGKTYSEALRHRVLSRVGLDDTGYDDDSEVHEHAAVGYVRGFEGYRLAPHLDPTVPYSAGMLYSTVDDLYKWGISFDSTGPFRQLETKNLMFSAHADLPAGLVAAAGLPAHYGYGIFVGDVALGADTVRVIEHGGSIFGFATGFWRMPDDRNMVILLDNSSSSSIREIGRGIMKLLYGRQPPAPGRPISDLLFEIIETDGIAAAVDRYKSLLETRAASVDLSEAHLNVLGYHYLAKDETDKAVAVLELNTEGYPESPNAYDSLAEAYLKAGDRDHAIEKYRKVLEVDPDNETAVRMLGQLTAGEH